MSGDKGKRRSKQGSPAEGGSGARDARVSLPRALSKLGLCSRAQAVDAVRAGRVRVDGETVRDVAFRVDMRRDRIELDGERARAAVTRLLAALVAGAALAGCSRAQAVDTARTPVPVDPLRGDSARAVVDTAAPAPRRAEESLPAWVFADTSSLSLVAVISERRLYVLSRGKLRTWYDVAVGKDNHPTPTGNFTIHRLIWNPSWTPPDAEWARGKQPKGPKDPGNPMKAVKIFFKEPDYYIHGTGDIRSLGSAASHGCLRMHPESAARLAQQLMDESGVSWDWSRIKRLLHIGETKTVNLKRPIAMVVLPGEPVLEAGVSGAGAERAGAQ